MLTPQTHEGTMTYDSLNALAPPKPGDINVVTKSGTSYGYGGGVGSGSGAGGVFKMSDSSSPILHGIYGKVADPSGAVIPNAHVTATNSSGESRTAYSNSSGEFSLELDPGIYKVLVEVPGFNSLSQNGIQVFSGPAKYLDYKMAVSALSEMEISVEAGKLEREATGQDLGDLFEYHLKEKVTILKNHSALVPIINSHIEAEKVTLWNGSSGRPLRALWITNSSGLTLDSGSFNIIENNAFAGEGLIEPLKPQERRLLSYAVDQAVRVEAHEEDESRPITHVKIARGVLIQTREQAEHKSYTLRNTDSEPREVIIEHPVRDGWKLAKDLKPEETTASFYRFRVKVQPNQTATLKIDEFEPIESTLALANVTDDQIKLFFSQKTIKPGVEQALRENMKALKGSTEEKALLQRYTRELNEQEDKLQSVRAESSRLELRRAESRQQLDRMLQDLSLDEAI